MRRDHRRHPFLLVGQVPVEPVPKPPPGPAPAHPSREVSYQRPRRLILCSAVGRKPQPGVGGVGRDGWAAGLDRRRDRPRTPLPSCQRHASGVTGVRESRPPRGAPVRTVRSGASPRLIFSGSPAFRRSARPRQCLGFVGPAPRVPPARLVGKSTRRPAGIASPLLPPRAGMRLVVDFHQAGLIDAGIDLGRRQ